MACRRRTRMSWALVLGCLPLFVLPGGCMSVENKITGTSAQALNRCC